MHKKVKTSTLNILKPIKIMHENKEYLTFKYLPNADKL